MTLIEPIHADFNKNISDRFSVISVPNKGASKPYQETQN